MQNGLKEKKKMEQRELGKTSIHSFFHLSLVKKENKAGKERETKKKEIEKKHIEKKWEKK